MDPRWCLFTLLLVPHTGQVEAASYRLVPVTGSATVTSVSNNGWVAGTTGSNKAFLWSQEGGKQLTGDLPGGAVSSTAKGVNSSGQVVGFSATGTGNHAFLWDAVAGIRDIGDLSGSTSSSATGINEQSHVVITSSGVSGYSVFLWSPDAAPRDIGKPAGGNHDVFGSAINDQDQIVGHTSLNGVINAFLWDPVAGMTGLGDLPTGADVSYAFALNNTSRVVGRGNTTEGDRAYLWEPGTGMQNLGTMPGGFGSYAYGLNNLGQVVGHFTLGGQHRAFLWSAATGMTDLNLLADAEATGWLLLEAYDINDSGWIVGLGVNPDETYQGFLLIPIASASGDIAPAGAPDGQINVADLMRLMRFIAHLEDPGQDMSNADSNADGVLDMRDVLSMGKLLGY
jgi:probable HAF family extracellular repeat protein